MIKERLHTDAVPTLPIGKEDSFRGIIDLIDLNVHYIDGGTKAETDAIPEEMQDLASRAPVLIETLLTLMKVMASYGRKGEAVRGDKKALQGVLANKLVPVLLVHLTRIREFSPFGCRS